jgi:hypothetical protein
MGSKLTLLNTCFQSSVASNFSLLTFNKNVKVNTVTGSRYADCHCNPTAGYIVAAAGVTEFPEICAVATQRKGGYEFLSVVTITIPRMKPLLRNVKCTTDVFPVTNPLQCVYEQ